MPDEPASCGVLEGVCMRTQELLQRIEGRGYSIRRVADRTGFNSETVRRYLAGITELKVTFLIRLCQAYQINPNYLLTGEPPARTTEATNKWLKARLAEIVEGVNECIDGGDTETRTTRATEQTVPAPDTAIDPPKPEANGRLRAKRIPFPAPKSERIVEPKPPAAETGSATRRPGRDLER